ncbi:uncharacterized protein LOC124154264 isoform X2 [Ischnura elegans]|uniref:uncharacterized protein LOC124154264 isoform X2 n=1 Tax=Ischnura elegans TaxID=197161 RepID=UPI001ED8A400|nr:uncharacterized protein LOC124154264 isoform X2 [Ischnura elegans]
MKVILYVWLFNFSCYFGFIQSAKCPAICVCYKWHQHLRIDCVKSGLVNVNIGLDNGDGSKGFAGSIYPVQVLDLSYNSISSLREGAFNSPNFVKLESLHLSHNSIADVSVSALQGLGHLKLLDLSYNRLRIVSGSITPYALPAQFFKDAPNLRALRLGSNPLENEGYHGKSNNEEGTPFLVAPRLEYLDLGSCHLGHVGHKAFAGLESLKALNISDNQLISLNPIAFENLTNLVDLWLYANPWPCDQTSEMQILEEWLSKKEFGSACPKKMFEKMIVASPTDAGPQKAEDDRSLLYYYVQLELIAVEQDPLQKIYHHHIDIPDDVQVFDEKALDPRFHQFERITNFESNLTEDSVSKNEVNFSLDGIPIFFYFILSFMAGALFSFLCTFMYFTKPCGGFCADFVRMLRQGSSSDSRRRCLNRFKSLSRGETSFTEMRSSRTNGEMYSLIDGSLDEIHTVGLTTPVMPRAAPSAPRIETPPPSYAEHLSLHPIGRNS